VTTIVPIVHPMRARRGVVVRAGSRLAEASPLEGRSRESYDDVLAALTLGGEAPASVDFARWTLETAPTSGAVTSQVLLEDPRTAIAVARTAIARGARAFKLKIRASGDAEVLAGLRALASGLRLRVDANRAFASERDVPWDVLARADVEWIEEPCPSAGSLAGTPVPIALDESVVDDAAAALEDARDHRAAALVLKPMLLGARETLRIGRAALAADVRVVVSHAFESEVGRRAAEELARRLAPGEVHGLARWDGIDAWRSAAGGTNVRSLIDGAEMLGDPALG
jgi:L-alanine-DL-glutamate epimerase-like enolase superfamily enzyme